MNIEEQDVGLVKQIFEGYFNQLKNKLERIKNIKQDTVCEIIETKKKLKKLQRRLSAGVDAECEDNLRNKIRIAALTLPLLKWNVKTYEKQYKETKQQFVQTDNLLFRLRLKKNSGKKS